VIGFVALAELFEFAITFVPIAGEFIKWFTNIIVWMPVQLWLRFKGLRSDYYIAGQVIEFIPVLNALPTKTTMLIITVILHNKGITKTISKVKMATKTVKFEKAAALAK